jgi:hypothetical protein
VLSARESLDLIRDTSYAAVRKEDQKKIKDSLMRRAKNIRAESKLNLSNKEMAEIMARRMLEVQNRG